MRAPAVVALVLLVARADAQRDPNWELRVPERVDLVAGSGGTLSIALAVDRGLKISRDAELVIDLAPEGGVAVKRRRLGRADAVDPDADAPRFAIGVRADAAGDFSLKVRVRFWLCGAKVCRPVDARRGVLVVATAPSPPPPDAGVDAPADAGRPRK